VIAQRLVAAVLGLLLAVQVVRTAAVNALASASPTQAAKIWPGHPLGEVGLGMVDIAKAAVEHRPISNEVLSRIYSVSTKAPLSPEPWMVRGVQAQMAGHLVAAEQAFLAACWRDPRALPARYFLADLYLRNGQARRGLAEIAVLARLVPDGTSKLAPYVAAYARDRDNWPVLRAMFRANRALEYATLSVLASDAANADAVIALADPRRRNAASSWLPVVLESLSEAGLYDKARDVWSQISGARLARGTLIFDPQFERGDAPPPFNWTLTSSTVGIAERQRGRGLHVIYYGQTDGALASQLLVLRPGRYRLVTNVWGPPESAGGLRWMLVCARDNQTLASVPLEQAISREWLFEVPQSCRAQRLELFGSASDIARQTELIIRSVRLSREGLSA
jgi:hypothetical protein